MRHLIALPAAAAALNAFAAAPASAPARPLLTVYDAAGIRQACEDGLARHRKARTMAITDATLSEVAKLAQIRIYYSSNSPAYVRSPTALPSLIQALAYGVYSRDAEQYADRIKAFRLK